MMTIACPTCQELFGLPSTLAGKLFTCPSCRAETTIPRPEDIHRPGPSVKAAFSVVTACLRCSRVIHVEPDKAGGWLACPSCSLVFSVARPPEPPHASAPFATSLEADDHDDDALEKLRRRRARKHNRRRLIVGGVVAGVLLLLIGVLVVRHTSRPKTGRDIILHFKSQRLIDRDVYVPPSREFDGHPAWLLFQGDAVGAILLELETEGDAAAFPVGYQYGRFRIVPYPGSPPAFAVKLHRSLP